MREFCMSETAGFDIPVALQSFAPPPDDVLHRPADNDPMQRSNDNADPMQRAPEQQEFDRADRAN